MSTAKFACGTCSSIADKSYYEECYIDGVAKSLCRECAYTAALQNIEIGAPVRMYVAFAVYMTLEECLAVSVVDRHEKTRMILQKTSTGSGIWYAYGPYKLFRFYAAVNLGRHNMGGRDSRMDVWFFDHTGYEWYGRCCRGTSTPLFRRIVTKKRRTGFTPKQLSADHDTMIELDPRKSNK